MEMQAELPFTLTRPTPSEELSVPRSLPSTSAVQCPSSTPDNKPGPSDVNLINLSSDDEEERILEDLAREQLKK
ncbi:Protein of unknown function [Cotesia congregata]|uniref:Uncharacterized protein n=1 Tax=Cotesia congregata TaxID=51543 RepID=A0A8J2EII5_COTCN|nr:Protein of unknown function [Cotesia congregata]